MLDRIVGEALSLSGRLQRMAADARPPSLADLASDRMLLAPRQCRSGWRGRAEWPRMGADAPRALPVADSRRDSGVRPRVVGIGANADVQPRAAEGATLAAQELG